MKAKNAVQPQPADRSPNSAKGQTGPETGNPTAISQTQSSFAAGQSDGAALDDPNSLEAQIRELAYWLYEERGGTGGSDLQDWLEAEAMIRRKSKIAA